MMALAKIGNRFECDEQLTHEISIVIPCYNEDEVINTTHARILKVLSTIQDTQVEIIYVDDGSTDSTWEKLVAIREANASVHILRLSRNFGHQMAITAGMEHATGDAIIVIDADLQDPPELIPAMVLRWREGADVVYGRRTVRAGETHFKQITAKLFYRFLNSLSDINIPADTGDFRLMDRRIVSILLKMPERDRYTRGLVAWIGFNQVSIDYEREARTQGVTKYPFFKMLRFALDGIFSFSLRPLRLASLLGFFVSGIALVVLIYAITSRLLGDPVTGWTALITSVLFLGGIQLICLGLIGEYVGRSYGELKHRPLYIIAEQRDLLSKQEEQTHVHMRQDSPKNDSHI